MNKWYIQYIFFRDIEYYAIKIMLDKIEIERDRDLGINIEIPTSTTATTSQSIPSPPILQTEIHLPTPSSFTLSPTSNVSSPSSGLTSHSSPTRQLISPQLNQQHRKNGCQWPLHPYQCIYCSVAIISGLSFHLYFAGFFNSDVKLFMIAISFFRYLFTVYKSTFTKKKLNNLLEMCLIFY